jgi:S-disulfanyl-L-cysteine oxidoreductase SoxD
LILSALTLLVVAGSSGIAQTQVTRTITRSIWDGVYTDAQARRGEELYRQHCSRCHGANLEGGVAITPPWPSGLDRTPTLVGPLFNDHYKDLPLSDLVERIRISMPQDRPGSLTRQAAVDVMAYLLLKNGFPVGRAELGDRFEDLREIQIVAYRP